MILSKEDNNIILNHIQSYNLSGVPISEMMAMDCYIERIEFEPNDIKFYSIKTKYNPIPGIEEHHHSKGLGEIGDYIEASLNDFHEPFKMVFISAIREIKINKINGY